MPASNEDVVTKALGPFGLWQARGCLLVALVKIPSAWQMLTIIFSAPQPFTVGGRFWCARPSVQWNVDQWINYSHPPIIKLDGTDGYDPCQVFDINYPLEPLSPLSPITVNATRYCSDFEIEQDFPSVVTKWTFVCSREMLVNVIQHFYLEGILFGGIATFILLKWFSPRVVLLIGVILQIAAGIGIAFVPLYQIHMALKLLTGLGCCIMFSAGFQICWDITNAWQRIVICVCYEHFWSIGVISLGWLSDLSRSWVTLQLIISIPSVLIIFIFWWIPDSPRWHIAKGNIDLAKKILYRGAAMNQIDLSPNFEIKQSSPPPTPPVKTSLPTARVTALVILWIITVPHYYGGLLNIRSTGGPRLPVRTSLAGVAEVVGATFGMIILLRCRTSGFRFLILSLLLAVGGTACVASWALPPNRGGGRQSWSLLGLALTGRVSIACSLAILSCGGSAELIPLPRRPLTLLILASVGRLFLTSAPFINSLAQYGETITLTVYGTTALLGAIAALFLAIHLLMERQHDNKNDHLNDLNIQYRVIRAKLKRLFFLNQQPNHSVYEDSVFGIYFNNPCFINDNNEATQNHHQQN